MPRVPRLCGRPSAAGQRARRCRRHAQRGRLHQHCLACTASGMALAVRSRAVPTAVPAQYWASSPRQGSSGLGRADEQMLTVGFGWRTGVLGFSRAGRGNSASRLVRWQSGQHCVATGCDQIGETSVKAAIGTALRTPPFINGWRLLCVRDAASVHHDALAVYLAICSMDRC